MLLLPTGLYKKYSIPSDLEGLEVWLDPSDSDYYVLNGSDYSSITDKSINGHVFSASTVAKQPLQQTKANGLTYMNFDEVANQCMFSNTQIDLTGTDKVTLFWAGQRHQAGSACFYEHSVNTNNVTTGFLFAINGSSEASSVLKGDVGYHNPNIAVSSTTPLNTDEVYVATMDKAIGAGLSEVSSIWKNGVSQILEINLQANNTNNFGLHKGYIGTRGDAGTVDLDGDYYELLIYNRVLTDTEIRTINNYLNRKWDLY